VKWQEPRCPPQCAQSVGRCDGSGGLKPKPLPIPITVCGNNATAAIYEQLEGRFSSVKVSALALIVRLPILGSAAQCGIKPHCMSLHSLPPFWRTIAGTLGVSGATLKRGVYSGRSWSRFQRTRTSLNSNVAVNRPHIWYQSYIRFGSPGQRRAKSTQSRWAMQ
jgi:hypothetical protein